jgi:hypothetical protein
MRAAIDETYRRRRIQIAFNEEHGITPQGIRKAIRDITDRVKKVAEERAPYTVAGALPKEEIPRVIADLESQMKAAAKQLEFAGGAPRRNRRAPQAVGERAGRAHEFGRGRLLTGPLFRGNGRGVSAGAIVANPFADLSPSFDDFSHAMLT